MKRISWFQPTDDHRPLSFPPNENVLGWWKTGEGDRGATLVAIVKAESEEEAQQVILKDWPEVVDWRFCGDQEHTRVTSRYPLQDWMIERGIEHYE